MGLTWLEIAKLLGISRMTLYRKRLELELPERFSDITDTSLLLQVSSIKEIMPDAGERMLAGALKSRGLKIPRRRIRAALHEIDPINTALRWAPHIKRRPYSVPGANALWHLGVYKCYDLYCA